MPDYGPIKRAHPDFPVETIPGDIPNWLVFQADAVVAPTWSTEDGCDAVNLLIWPPGHHAGQRRFVVFTLSAETRRPVGQEYATNDWNMALEELRRRWAGE